MADTGPPYPPLALSGSNGIGEFQIGESQIGDIPEFVYWKTILSQYANSPRLIQLIQNLDSYLDQTANFNAFYDLVMNVETAQGYGLDVWGRIVGVNRTLQVQTINWFGFAEAQPGTEGFNLGPGYTAGGPFYSGETLTSNYQLSDDSYRTLIFAKAAANITNGSIPAINQILLNLFPNRGNCYVTDGNKSPQWFGFAEAGNTLPFNQGVFYDGESVPYMTISYVFNFNLTPVEIAIVEQSGVLPKPVGVLASTVIN